MVVRRDVGLVEGCRDIVLLLFIDEKNAMSRESEREKVRVFEREKWMKDNEKRRGEL
jgi:hypothetical protein